MTLAFTIIFVGSLIGPAWSQVGPEFGTKILEEMEVLDFTLPEYTGRCHACVFASPYSIYVTEAPVCMYDVNGQVYNIAEDIDRYTCGADDPRLYEDIQCKTKVSNDTFQCYNGCPENHRIQEGETYSLEADRLCSFKVDFWDKEGSLETVRKLLFGSPDEVSTEPIDAASSEATSAGESGTAGDTTEDTAADENAATDGASALVDKSPFGEDVWFFVTVDKMDLVAGRERVDRNNIPDLRIGIDSEIELKDLYYLLVINMGTEPI